jgi:hypothetical protein
LEESGIGASTRKSEGDRKRKRLQEKRRWRRQVKIVDGEK